MVAPLAASARCHPVRSMPLLVVLIRVTVSWPRSTPAGSGSAARMTMSPAACGRARCSCPVVRGPGDDKLFGPHGELNGVPGGGDDVVQVPGPVSYTHLRAHETDSYLVCRLLLEKKKNI